MIRAIIASLLIVLSSAAYSDLSEDIDKATSKIADHAVEAFRIHTVVSKYILEVSEDGGATMDSAEVANELMAFANRIQFQCNQLFEYSDNQYYGPATQDILRYFSPSWATLKRLSIALTANDSDTAKAEFNNIVKIFSDKEKLATGLASLMQVRSEFGLPNE